MILELLAFCTFSGDDVKKSDCEYLELKQKFDHLIDSDKFIDLTLTYDYEGHKSVGFNNQSRQ